MSENTKNIHLDLQFIRDFKALLAFIDTGDEHPIMMGKNDDVAMPKKRVTLYLKWARLVYFNVVQKVYHFSRQILLPKQ